MSCNISICNINSLKIKKKNPKIGRVYSFYTSGLKFKRVLIKVFPAPFNM